MKTAFTALLLFFSISMAVGQAMCKGLRFADKAIIANFDYQYHRFKKYDNTNNIPDSVKQRIAQATIKETSRAFFRKLKVKKLFVCDSTVYKRLYDPSRMVDDEGNNVYHVYSFLYELKLNDSVPFQFRVDYNQNGDLIRKVQLTSIECKRSRIINCDKAITTALADKTGSIHGIDQIYLLVNPLQKTVVYQINSIMDPETNMVYIKTVNAYNGKIIERQSYKVEVERLEETRIGG